MSLVLAIVLFIAFTVGLNLGLHGVIVLNSESKPIETLPHENFSKLVHPIHTNHGEKKRTDATPFKVSNYQHPKEDAAVSHEEHQKRQTFQDEVLHEKLESEPKTDKPVENLPQVIEKENNSNEKSDSLRMKLHSTDELVEEKVSSLVPASASEKYSDTPIVLLTCNRPQLLEETIKSILSVRGVSKDKLLIVQDGNMADIQNVAKTAGLSIIQNKEGLRLRGGAATDGATRIAMHYKFALTSAFDHFSKAQAIVIIEDDLLFSPDFYEYLTTAALAMDNDDSLFVASAWSDNGFKGKVQDKLAVRRTDFFPGLGWILTRKLYKGELEEQWPQEHWDHWLRSPEIHRYREVIYPQVPRSFHNGVKGTFMNEATHNKYFRDIDYNKDTSVSWKGSTSYLSATSDIYEYRIEKMIQSCKHLSSVRDLVHMMDEVVCIWIDLPADSPYGSPPFETVASFFGIWHEHKRGNHRGLHEFYWEGNYILLLNLDSTNIVPSRRFKQLPSDKTNNDYRKLKPRDVQIMRRDMFDKKLLEVIKLKKVDLSHVVKATDVDLSCDQVCNQQSKKCAEVELDAINNCGTMQKYFSCERCEISQGHEQPAYVREDAPEALLPGVCLINSDPKSVPIQCSAHHPNTIRLCACV